jgi:hypothetical protein
MTMGYRSDVGYAIVFRASGDDSSPKHEKAFAEFSHFVEHLRTYRETCSEEFRQMQIDKDKLIISYQAEHIKWYEDYPIVQWHNSLLEKVKTYETGNYRFVRIGEETDDIEEDNHSPTAHMWDYIDVRREVVIEHVGDELFDVFKDEEETTDE